MPGVISWSGKYTKPQKTESIPNLYVNYGTHSYSVCMLGNRITNVNSNTAGEKYNSINKKAGS